MSLRWGVVGALVWVGVLAGEVAAVEETSRTSCPRDGSATNKTRSAGVPACQSQLLEPEFPREGLVAQNTETDEALQFFQEGMALFRESTAESLQAAIEKFAASIALFEARNEAFSEATARYWSGFAHFNLGYHREALAQYERAIVIFEAAVQQAKSENLQTAQTWQAATLGSIGSVYNALGEKSRALEFFNQALPLLQAVGDRSGEATTLNNIGMVYDSLGERQRALEYYNQALSLNQAVGNRSGEATTLNNIGQVYNALGEKQRALDFLNQALSLSRAVGNRGGEARTLGNIGRVYLDLGEKQKALEFYNQALPLFQVVGDRRSEAVALVSMGVVYNALGERQQALNFFNQALPIHQAVGDRSSEAITLNNIGGIYDALGEKQRALDFFYQALPLLRAVGDISGEANTLRNAAWVYRDQGQLPEALTNIQDAIALIEQLRSLTPPGELRQTYFTTVQDYYQLQLDLLMQLQQQQPNSPENYAAQAFQTSESIRARTLIEQLSEANLDIRQGVDPSLLTQEQDLIQQLNATEQQRITLLKSTYDPADLEAIKTKIQQTLQQLKDVESRIRQASPAYAQLNFPDPLTLEEVQDQILDNDTLLLEYALGAEQSYLFLVSKTGLQTYTLPPQAEIEAAVEAYRDKLQDRSFTDLSQGLALSEMLLGQVAGQLGDKRLLVVSNGKLQLLPFGALPSPENSVGAIPPWLPQTGVGTGALPLLTRHEIITLPSATSLAVQRQTWQNRPIASKTVAVFADPVFTANDNRFTGNHPPTNSEPDGRDIASRFGCTDFARLHHTATEANQILDLVPDAEEFSALGFAANHDAATDANLSQYQILHLATHGCIQDDARLSGLALSFYEQNGNEAKNNRLTLQDIYNLELNAELVVLSACQTGIGDDIAGEGVVGLTSGFFYAGAKRVVVSLWNVNDQATSDLMSDYYRRMLEEGKDPNQALRQAQLNLWNSDEFAAPFYWAAFTVQGEF